MKKWIYRFSFVGVILWFFTGFVAFKFLIRATPHDIQLPAVFEAYDTQSVLLTTQDSMKVAGWYIQSPKTAAADAAVILLACLRGNRLNLIDRARFYLAQEKSVLLIDLRSTGESGGDFTSFGWYEKNDLVAAYNFLAGKEIQKIGLHGISVGAATICYALPNLGEIQFLVLESCYDKMENAVRNRTQARFGLPAPFFLAIIVFAQFKFDFQFYEMNPIDFLHLVKSPVFVIAGEADLSVLSEETQALYRQLPYPKRLWLIPGCGHDDFYQLRPLEYEMQLNLFFREYHLTSGE